MWFSVLPALAMSADAIPAPERFLARGAQAEAAIIIGQDSGPFYRWVAGEVQRYVHQLSGAELPIATADAVPPQRNLIVLGGPEINPLVAAAEQKQLVRFAGLKPDGFVVRTVELDGRPAIVAGGNDEAGTMYAGYELLERLGIVFQLTNDIIPQRKTGPAAARARRPHGAGIQGSRDALLARNSVVHGPGGTTAGDRPVGQTEDECLPVLLGHGRTLGRVLLRRQGGGDQRQEGVRLRRLAWGQRNRQQRARRPGLFSARWLSRSA